jgi:hypothetical protein
MSDNPYAKFAPQPSDNQYKKFKSEEAPTEAPEGRHLFSPGEDIAREFKEGKDTLENTSRYNPLKLLGGLQMATAVPMGLAKAGIGSLLAKGLENNLEAGAEMHDLLGKVIPGIGSAKRENGPTESQLKKAGDAAVDVLSLGIGAPEISGAKLLSTEEKLLLLQSKARERVTGAGKLDNLSAQQILDKQNAARAVGDAEIPAAMGENLTRLTKTIRDKGGQTGSDIDKFLTEAWAKGDKNLKDQISKIKGGSTYKTQEALAAGQKQISAPLFEEAGSSHTIAPLETQFRNQLGRHLDKRETALSNLRKAQEHFADLEAQISVPLPGHSPPSSEEVILARQTVAQAEEELDGSNQYIVDAQKMVGQAEKEKELGVPGSVYSPKLDAYWKNDNIVQSGMKSALRIERRNALAEGRPFINKDYAIDSWKSTGRVDPSTGEEIIEPVITKVPTMKAWMGANEALKGMAQNLVHTEPGIMFGRPTKEGLSVKKLQEAVQEELTEIRPIYGKALEAWSGPADAVRAISAGKDFFNNSSKTIEQLQAEFSKLSPSQKEFFKLAAAETKVNDLSAVSGKQVMVDGNPSSIGNTANAAVRHEQDIQKFRMLFGGDADAAREFFESVVRRQEFQNSAQKISANLAKDSEKEAASKTKDTLASAATAGVGAVLGHPFMATRSGIQAIQKLLGGSSEKLDKATLDILLGHAPVKVPETSVPVRNIVKPAAGAAISGSSFTDLLNEAQSDPPSAD